MVGSVRDLFSNQWISEWQGWKQYILVLLFNIILAGFSKNTVEIMVVWIYMECARIDSVRWVKPGMYFEGKANKIFW